MSVPATFVTNDSRMSHGKLHDDDLRVLAEAGRGEGRVVKPEELATLAEAAASTWRAAQADAARVLTPGGGMAQIIRRLRCEEGCKLPEYEAYFLFPAMVELARREGLEYRP